MIPAQHTNDTTTPPPPAGAASAQKPAHTTTPPPDILRLAQVSKAYVRTEPVLRNINLTVRENEIVVIVGNSGSGKTTLLRIIAGLEDVDSGHITIGTTVVTTAKTRTPPAGRNIGYIFQEHALFPHLTVQKNIEFGLHRHSRHQRHAITQELLTLLQIPQLAQRYPHQISGGQVQRVAIARAIAPRPRILLLDEPFNNLDITLREAILPDLHAILKRYRIAALCITHLPQEAFAIADRIAVLDQGGIAQIDEPRQLYLKPVNKDIAQFFGLINCIPAHYSRQHQLVYLSRTHFFIPTAADACRWSRDTNINILLRPDELELFFDLSAQECRRTDLVLLHGVIVKKKFYGYYRMLHIRITEEHLPITCVAHIPTSIRILPQQKVLVGLPVDSMHIV